MVWQTGTMFKFSLPEKLVGLKSYAYKVFTLYTQKIMMTGLSHCVLCIVYWMKFSYRGKNWTLGMHNSMEILKNSENVLLVCGFFDMLIP